MKEDSGRLQVVTGEKWQQAEGFKPAPAKSECLRHAKKAENTNCIYVGRGRNCSNWYKIRVTPFLCDPLFSWDFCTVSVKNCGVQFASNVNSFINNQYNTCKAWPIDNNSEQNSCTLKSRSFSATAPKDVFLQIWAAWPSSLPISQTEFRSLDRLLFFKLSNLPMCFTTLWLRVDTDLHVFNFCNCKPHFPESLLCLVRPTEPRVALKTRARLELHKS